MLIRSKSQSELRDASLWIRTGAILLGAALLGLWGMGFPDNHWDPVDWRELAGVCLVALSGIGLGLLGMGWATHMEDDEARTFAGGTIVNPSSLFVGGLAMFALVGVVLLLRCAWVAIGMGWDTYAHRGKPDPAETLERFVGALRAKNWGEATELLSPNARQRLEIEKKSLQDSLFSGTRDIEFTRLDWSAEFGGSDRVHHNLRGRLRPADREAIVRFITDYRYREQGTSVQWRNVRGGSGRLSISLTDGRWLIDDWDGERAGLSDPIKLLVDALMRKDWVKAAEVIAPESLAQIPDGMSGLANALLGPHASANFTGHGYNLRHRWTSEPEAVVRLNYYADPARQMGWKTISLTLKLQPRDDRWIVVSWLRDGSGRESSSASSKP